MKRGTERHRRAEIPDAVAVGMKERGRVEQTVGLVAAGVDGEVRRWARWGIDR